jgi:peptide deformylase
MEKMLKILHYPDPRLAEVSVPVTKFDEKLHKLLDGMAETMYEADGIGLAAPQVDERIRVFIIDLGDQEGQPKKKWEFINPKLSNGEGKIVFEEGCLSVPGLTEEVTRKERVTLNYQDRFGKARKLEAEGLLAVAIQHENDHLDGVVFVDRLSPIKRRLAKRKLAKQVTL